MWEGKEPRTLGEAAEHRGFSATAAFLFLPQLLVHQAQNDRIRSWRSPQLSRLLALRTLKLSRLWGGGLRFFFEFTLIHFELIFILFYFAKIQVRLMW